MRRTNPGERRINEQLNAFKTLQVVTQPNLNDLMLRDRGSNDIKYIVKSRKTDSLQILPWVARLLKPCKKWGDEPSFSNCAFFAYS